MNFSVPVASSPHFPEDARDVRRCPALVVSAPASGQGKTMVTAALARWQRNQGRRMRVFKIGPDFIDPMILERASGNPVYQLDLWMAGEDRCRELLYEAAGSADLILIEGVMGLFDGNPSSADLAARFGIPVLAVIDAGAMAQTFGAVAAGLKHYRDDVPFFGVLANRVGGTGHAAMLAGSVPEGIPFLGALPRAEAFSVSSRHLGLRQAAEIEDLERRLDEAAAVMESAKIALHPEAVEFCGDNAAPPQPLLAGTRIAVARDEAFSFIYAANLDLLRAMGAELRFFSPLADDFLPECDSLYLPGGYPELHLERLEGNDTMRASLRAHHLAGKPIVAECGGMLYLMETLADSTGRTARMAELLPGRASMQKSLQSLALQSVELPDGLLRGHTFHHSSLETALAPIVRGHCPNGGTTAEAVYRVGRLTASYIHFYFPSAPQACARLFLP